MSEPRTHIVIGTPCFGGQVTNLYASSLLKLQHLLGQQKNIDLTVLMLGGDALITRARQNIVAQFMEMPDATHLLFIDADIGFEPEQFFRILNFDHDMVAAIYPTKRIDWDKVRAAVQSGKENLDKAALSYVMEFVPLKEAALKNGFAKVRFAGTGFLMIKREVIVKMVERYPELKYARENRADDSLKDSPWRFALFNCMIDPATGVYLSEDFSFCRRWIDMGGEIWADLQSRLTHTGPISLVGDAATQFPVL
jgi:hypothetical protein